MAASVHGGGAFCGCPYGKSPTTWGFVLGSLIFGNCLVDVVGVLRQVQRCRVGLRGASKVDVLSHRQYTDGQTQDTL